MMGSFVLGGSFRLLYPPCGRGLDYGHGHPFPPLHGLDKRPHSVKLPGRVAYSGFGMSKDHIRLAIQRSVFLFGTASLFSQID